MHLVRPVAVLICVAGCTSVPQAPGPYTLEVAEPVPAITTPGDELPLAVRVIDASGTPIPGIAVSWDGDGSIESVGGPTDADGIARGRWALPRWEQFPTTTLRVGPSGRFAVMASAPGMTSVRLETTARAFTADQVDARGCGIRQGELWCWSAWEGFEGVPTRVEVAAPSPLREVRTSSMRRCVLDARRLPWCAYRGGAYALVTGVPPLGEMRGPGFSSLVGMFCGLAMADRRPWCWPDRADDPRTPWRPLDEPLAALGVGEMHACGLKGDGSIWCWGGNDFGQFGDGTTTGSDVPVAASGGHQFTELGVGGWMTCGIKANAEVWCRGRGITTVVPVPTRNTLVGILGPARLELGPWGDGYLLASGGARGWIGTETMWWLSGVWRHVPLTELDVDSWTCARSVTSEVYCSWTMLRTVSANISTDLELVAVPDPVAVSGPPIPRTCARAARCSIRR